MALAAISAADLQQAQRNRAWLAAPIAVTLAILLGLLAGMLSGGRSFLAVGVVLTLVLPFVWWRAPASGVVTLLGCATVVEQFQYSVGIPGLDAFTDKLPIFTSLSSGFNVSGLVMSPMDIAVVALLLVWLTRGVSERSLAIPRTQVAAAIGVMLLLASLALLRGLTSTAPGAGGESAASASLWEYRPWLYMAAAFLFSSQVIRTRRAVQAVLWTFVLGTGFKALQGVYIFWETRNEIPRPEAILAHEESVFFAIFTILTMCLWLFGHRGWLRTTATVLLPFVIIADLGNDRRDGVLIMGAELIVLGVLAYISLPEKRRLIARISAVALVLFAVYMPLEWNGTGTLSGVAQAIRSGVAPDPRDAQSNEYRIDEDADLGAMIKKNVLLGTGFGVPIQYNLTPVQTISASDTFINYVPHNTLLYIWVRMGLPGEVALWMLVAVGLFAGVRASRSKDREVALIGTLAACTVIGWVIMGYTDMGFWWFRVALALGVLLGVLHASVERERVARTAGGVTGAR